MAGVKGRSGRKGKAYQAGLLGILSSAEWIINRFLKDEEQSLKDRADIASRFILKRMPEKVEQLQFKITLSSDVASRLLDAINTNKTRRNLLPDRGLDQTVPL